MKVNRFSAASALSRTVHHRAALPVVWEYYRHFGLEPSPGTVHLDRLPDDPEEIPPAHHHGSLLETPEQYAYLFTQLPAHVGWCPDTGHILRGGRHYSPAWRATPHASHTCT